MKKIILILTTFFAYVLPSICQEAIQGTIMHNNIERSYILYIPQSYNGQEVLIRFAFAADPGYSTAENSDLTGVWVDNINVAGGVFTNDGEDATGFESKSLVPHPTQ